MLTTKDEMRVRMIVREETDDMRESIKNLDARLTSLELRFERFEHNVMGALKDILARLDDMTGYGPRIEQLESDVTVLKATR